ncbi:MAG: 2-oxoacid:acceptor oxidoreductase family protein [Thermodesulfobacteriota bacterium]|nr:2-oxoacid:acceptor oxidoreductase family protein [Thermodesulfobacteriota bacterium]
MNKQIVISGLGGQGVLFITRLLAEALMDEKEHVLTSETHGMAQRGGIVISHLKVGDFNSPLIRPGHADLVVALKDETLDQHYSFLKKGGKAIVNSLSDSLKDFSGDSSMNFLKEISASPENNIKNINADFLAQKDNNQGSVNLYMLGAALAFEPVCSIEKVKEQIEKRLAKKDKKIRLAAVTALEHGFVSV